MSKYRAVPTVVDGIRFASKREARRYGELKLLEKAGKISELDLQPRFKILIGDELICTYVADFDYVDENDDHVVEDVKGVKTAIYRLKAKLMKAVHGITIKET